MLPLSLLAALPFVGYALAEEGSISGPTTSSSAAGYSCDPNTCKLPNCHCASTDPPGGLSVVSLVLVPAADFPPRIALAFCAAYVEPPRLTVPVFPVPG